LADIKEAQKHIDDFYEPNHHYIDIRHTNAQKIYRIVDEIADLWEDYQTEMPNRFWNVTLLNKLNITTKISI
jgi:t-SNARE complex subunit (syntaxin)